MDGCWTGCHRHQRRSGAKDKGRVVCMWVEAPPARNKSKPAWNWSPGLWLGFQVKAKHVWVGEPKVSYIVYLFPLVPSLLVCFTLSKVTVPTGWLPPNWDLSQYLHLWKRYRIRNLRHQYEKPGSDRGEIQNPRGHQLQNHQTQKVSSVRGRHKKQLLKINPQTEITKPVLKTIITKDCLQTQWTGTLLLRNCRY